MSCWKKKVKLPTKKLSFIILISMQATLTIKLYFSYAKQIKYRL